MLKSRKKGKPELEFSSCFFDKLILASSEHEKEIFSWSKIKVMAENFLLTQIAFGANKSSLGATAEQWFLCYATDMEKRKRATTTLQTGNVQKSFFFSCCTTRKDCILMRNGYFRDQKKKGTHSTLQTLKLQIP